MSQYFDVIIIGAGPIGLACGLAAKNSGLSYVILEKGCLVNSIFNYPKNMTFFSTSERLEIGNIPFVSTTAKPTRTEALEYYRRVAANQILNIRLFEEVIEIKNKPEFYFQIITEKSNYDTKYLILATGFYDIPNLLGIKGEELAKVSHYYQEPHYYAFQKLVIVGANNSAVDAALECYRKGADVTMIIKGKNVGESVKYWAKPDIENRIKNGEIKAFFESEVLEIDQHTLQVKTPKGIIELENDFVLALTGYQPDFKFFKMIGISINKEINFEPQTDPDTKETNISNLYLAGVICGGMNTRKLFIENSREHAKQIFEDINRKEKC